MIYRHDWSPGFLLLEMAIAFAVLAFFTLAVTRLFVASIEQRADTALYLRMTQQARTLLEETLASDQVPRERSVSGDGITSVVRVCPISAPWGALPASCSLKNMREFFGVEVTVYAKTSRGIVRSFTFNLCVHAQRETQ